MSREIAENVDDLQNLLKDENLGEETPEETTETVETPTEEEELEELNLEDEEGLETKHEDGEEITLPQFKEITKKYPEFFKDFPNLRHAFFREKEYAEIFPTVDEARTAQEDVAGLRELEQAVTKGETESILEAIKELDDNAVSNFSLNFLPALRKVNQDVFWEVITPELVNFTRSMYDAGVRNGNDNLKNAALVASQHFFRDSKVASGEKNIETKQPQNKKPEDEELKRERDSFRRERYTSLFNDVSSDSQGKVMDLVLDGLDPRGTLTPGIKNMLAEKVIKEIDKVLSANPSHKAKMDAIWKKAGENGFSTSFKGKIIAAYLSSVEKVLPKVRSKVRSSTLGTRERNSEKSERRIEEREEPTTRQSNRGSRPANSGSSNGNKRINWSKTSDIDYLKGNVTYED